MMFPTKYADVYPFHVYHVGGFVHAGQYGYVAQQAAQAVALRVAAFHEDLHLFGRDVLVVHDGFQIALYAAYGGFQLMGDVLGQLPF